MAARTNKVTLSEKWKENIRVSQMMNRLIDCFEGKVELTAAQLKAADMVLKKVVPDLARSELTGLDGKDLIPDSVQINLVRPNATELT